MRDCVNYLLLIYMSDDPLLLSSPLSLLPLSSSPLSSHLSLPSLSSSPLSPFSLFLTSHFLPSLSFLSLSYSPLSSSPLSFSPLSSSPHSPLPPLHTSYFSIDQQLYVSYTDVLSKVNIQYLPWVLSSLVPRLS